jgi:uncharacterized protein YbjQ (UPF0145 family)
MIDDARSNGANAIEQVSFTSAEVAAGAAEILVYGTGVVLEEEDAAAT